MVDARVLVRSIINYESRLISISDMLQLHEDQSKKVIQVHQDPMRQLD